MASTTVTVLPVPGGPNTKYGARPDDPSRMQRTAVICCGLPVSFRSNQLESNTIIKINKKGPNQWVTKHEEAVDQLLRKCRQLLVCIVARSVLHRLGYDRKPSPGLTISQFVTSYSACIPCCLARHLHPSLMCSFLLSFLYAFLILSLAGSVFHAFHPFYFLPLSFLWPHIVVISCFLAKKNSV